MLKIKKDKITGSRRFSNYFWASIILFGGLGFFITGLSSYYKTNFVYFIKGDQLLFIPQGATIIFYGITGIIISSFLWYTIILNIGGGYNEFNHNLGQIIIFRLGFPGKNRVLELKYNINEVSAIKIKIKEEVNNDQKIYLKLKDNREIPLNKIGNPLSLSQFESEAVLLAKFLGVKIEGI